MKYCLNNLKSIILDNSVAIEYIYIYSKFKLKKIRNHKKVKRMLNGGAVLTDGFGNLPQLTSITKHLNGLSTQLQENRQDMIILQMVADQVLKQEQGTIGHLAQTVLSHQRVDSEDYEIDHANQAAEVYDDDDEWLEVSDDDEDDNDSTCNSPLLLQSLPVDTASENLELRIELQRMKAIEEQMIDLISKFNSTADKSRIGSKNYLNNHAIVSKSLIESYETKVLLEKRTQDILSDNKAFMIEELKNLKLIVQQSSILIGNDIRHNHRKRHPNEGPSILKFTNLKENQ